MYASERKRYLCQVDEVLRSMPEGMALTVVVHPSGQLPEALAGRLAMEFGGLPAHRVAAAIELVLEAAPVSVSPL